MLKVRAHTCYLGKTGYSSHARNFFKNLSDFVDLRVRNYTWDDNPDYLDEKDLSILETITLGDVDGVEKDYPFDHSFPHLNWKAKGEFTPDIDIVLMDMDHYYFYQDYQSKIKIAYTVWESTELPTNFFQQLLKFDYLWVVSQWHKDVIVKQGYPEHKVYVVNEGVETDGLFVSPKNTEKFQFMFFGRWDYRKAVPEIIKAFKNVFPTDDNVELILSADNPYSIDGFNSTEERLEQYDLTDERIKVKHFLSKEEYQKYIRSGHVLITCARSEGWNIPLIEAMAAGTPVTYSNWGAQLEFTKGEGNPVKIKEELPAEIGAKLGCAGYTPGLYAEPDFNDLEKVLLDCYQNYEVKLDEAIKISERIRRDFDWKKIAKDANSVLELLCGIKDSNINNELVVIMSHADTQEKISILKQNILHLKHQGYTIALSTHISYPTEIAELVDIAILDKDNPIIHSDEYHEYSETVPIFYINHEDYSISYTFDFNHGLAAFRLIKNGLNFAAKSKYFDKVHFVNYDYILQDADVLVCHSKQLDEEIDLVVYRWESENSYNTGLFSCKITPMVVDTFNSIHTKSDYFKWKDIDMLEYVVYKLCEENNLKVSINNLSDIVEKNIINSITIPTYPMVVNKIGSTHHVFLGRMLDEYYLAIVGSIEKNINIEFIYKDVFKRIFSTNQEVQFIHIPKEVVLSGFDVKVLETDIMYHYDRNSKLANIKIHNIQRIRTIDDGKIINNEKSDNKTNIKIHFVDGPFVEITGSTKDQYLVKFINQDNDQIIHQDTIAVNHWVRCNIKYFVNWKITVENLTTGRIITHDLDLKHKNVLIRIDSSALGDSLAWFPHIEEFRKKHNCNVFVSTFKNDLFVNNYPELKFVLPGQPVGDLYATYSIGWFYLDNDEPNMELHPLDFRKQPMQKTTTDILGLPYTSLKPKLSIPKLPRPIEDKYVCIAMHSTAQTKYWNNHTGWQEVTDYFLNKGWKVVMLSIEYDGYMGNHYPTGVISPEGERTLENAMNYLQHSEMFIGISSGLSWLAWAVGVPTTIISGWSWPITEVLGDDVVRIFKDGSCNGCFNRKRLDPGDWNFCPDHKGTERQFECTKIITGTYVIEEIEKFFQREQSEINVDKIVQESYELGMVQNHSEITQAAEFFKSLNIKDFIEIGTDQGGTFAIWSKLSHKDGLKISIDLPHGQFGRDDYDLEKRDTYLKSLGENIHMIHGDSHQESVKNQLKNLLNGRKVDFLFIDGDHTYEGVSKDLEMYSEFLKNDGWIAFHDIKDTEFHRNANCRVDKLWSELKGTKKEFIDTSSDFGGIGFIQNTKSKSCMMVHNYFGERRIKLEEYDNDKLFYLKKQIEYLSNKKHNLSHIVFSINSNNTPEENCLIEEVYKLIPDTIQNATTEILVRENYGMSYGAFSDIYSKYRTKYDYYFFVEDDYVFILDDFDNEMIRILNTSKNPGYLCGEFKGWAEGWKPHAANSIGVISSKALEAVYLDHGCLPHNENKFVDYISDEVHGQIAQSNAIHNAGFEVFDIRNYYKIYHVSANNKFSVSFSDNDKEIIAPIQRILTIDK